ncbi:hypothetical protein ACH5RR_007587 [Cinchona calisaya]|uniref:Cytochrome c biogenesis ccmF n=1 Tax=Cinchona calisaya TaxID=153742 RepID=A0ABD3ACJ0_9GENT
MYTPFVLRTLIDSKLCSREVKRTHPLWHLARDDKERAPSIDEQRIDTALGIALFFSPFLSASSDPFVRNFFVRTEPLAESNPVPQDPMSAIHPPCIYARDVASAMGFDFCRSKMRNRIVALHSPPMRKDAAEKNGTLFRSVGCLGSRIKRTFSIRSGLLAPVHSFATDDTRGIFLWRFFLLMTGISMILFSQMKQQASVRRTYKKEMVVARSTLVHLRHSARAQAASLSYGRIKLLAGLVVIQS